MTGQQLKNSILQMAVQGKLVPQDPNDEPASVLLERIRKEKEQLIKEGKIKKEKNPSYIFRGADNLPYEKVGKNEPVCIAEEVPFEIPDTWEWVRFSSVISLQSGQDMTPDCYNDLGIGIPYLTGASNIINGNVLINRWTDCGKAFAYKENLLITCKGTIGAMAILKEDIVHIARQIMAITPSNALLVSYAQLVLETLVTSLKSAAKSMIPGISRDDVLSSLLPLPPLNEQQRIVDKFQSLIPILEQYNTSEIKLSNLNIGFPDLLKKSILQEAVQGKLVPQDPADEPASVLLERIRAEKQRLVQEGKIKRDKHESVIFRRDNSHYEKRGSEEVCIDDELPFDIPENWCWSRLLTLCKSISDGDHQPPPQVPSGIPFVVISNVSSGKIDLSNTRFVSHDYYENLHESRIPCRDDILFTVTGSYGIVIPVDTEDAFCFQRHIALLKPLQITTEFLSTWLNTPIVYEQCKHCATGTAQKTVGLNSLKNILIPIPPINEQVRILEQLEEVLPLIAL